MRASEGRELGRSRADVNRTNPCAASPLGYRQTAMSIKQVTVFGASGFVRLNFGCRRALLVEALERMRLALAGR